MVKSRKKHFLLKNWNFDLRFEGKKSTSSHWNNYPLRSIN